MTKYWSCSTLAFYDDQIIDISQMPEDKVVISEAEYQALLEQQANGCVIVAGQDGSPEVMQQSCGQCENLIHDKKIASSTELGHVKIGEGINTDDDGTISVDLSPYAKSADLSTVATSGSFDDLSDKPVIDTELSATSENAVQNKAIFEAIERVSAPTIIYED